MKEKLKLKPGSLMEVEYKGEWWDANVIALGDGLVKIHYVGGILTFENRATKISCAPDEHLSEQERATKTSGYRNHRPAYGRPRCGRLTSICYGFSLRAFEAFIR